MNTQPPVQLELLASAVAGRTVVIVQRGDSKHPAYTDGECIYLPAGTADLQFVRNLVICQSALLTSEALLPEYLVRILGQPRVAERYTYLEVLRALHLLAERLPASLAERWLENQNSLNTVSSSAHDSLLRARSGIALPPLPEEFGLIRPLLALRNTKLVNKKQRALRSNSPRHIHTAVEDDKETEHDSDSSSLLKLFASPLNLSMAISQIFQKLLGTGRQTQMGEGSSSSPDAMAIGMQKTSNENLREHVAAATSRLETEADSETSLQYPEWEIGKNRFKADWVRVEETEIWNSETPRDITSLIKNAPPSLPRQLLRLGREHQWHPAQTDGEALDMTRLIDTSIELQAGQLNHQPRVYKATRKTRRDLAACVLVDISGSTAEHGSDGQSILDKQITLSYQLADTLYSLGDTVAVFGFHSWGRQLVRFVRLKSFDERWGRHIARRYAQLESRGYTRLGAAVRHADRQLRKQQLPHRLIFLITDGFAYDQDYESHYAEADTAHALEEARAHGTAIICLYVGKGTEASKLREIFGNSHFMPISEFAGTNPHLGRLCQHALYWVRSARPRSLATLETQI